MRNGKWDTADDLSWISTRIHCIPVGSQTVLANSSRVTEPPGYLTQSGHFARAREHACATTRRACMFDAGAHIGCADQCQSAHQLTHFDQTHTVNSTTEITPILISQNSHQLTRSRGSSAARFGGFRSGARARRAMDMAMGAHGEGS